MKLRNTTEVRPIIYKRNFKSFGFWYCGNMLFLIFVLTDDFDLNKIFYPIE